MLRRLLPIVLGIGLTACHKHASTEPTCVNCDVVQPPALTCPAAVTKTSPSSTVTALQVEYPAPTLNGGTEPVTTTCSPNSGSVFQAGKTTVTCTATDAIQRQGVCTIDVTVNVPAAPTPRLVGTKFLAFGDSITAGENTQFLAGPLFIDTAHAYPAVLQQLMTMRYSAQNPVVIQDGQSGESALDGTGRIEGDLNASAPNALLLLEGANDLAASNSFPADYLVNQVRNALQYDVAVAKSKGIKVFLSTQTPVVHCRGVSGPDCRDWAIRYTDLITPVNDAIRSLAAQSGVVLVDAFKALSTNTDLYIEPDGLHLTIDGQRILAEVFLAAIETNYEVPTTASTQRTLLRAPVPVVQPKRLR